MWVVAAAGVVRSEPVAALDDLPPAPPATVQAIDVPADAGGAIEVTWILSADDASVFVGTGNSSVLAAVGPVRVYRRHGLDAYRVYRRLQGETFYPIADVSAGVSRYIDATVFNNVRYIYEVRSVRGPHEVAHMPVPGSSADLARAAFARNDGAPGLIPGWFDPSDDRVDFNDFFLFADHFGTVEGQALYDPLYDLSPNHVVDFDDFFIFADNFGRRIGGEN